MCEVENKRDARRLESHRTGCYSFQSSANLVVLAVLRGGHGGKVAVHLGIEGLALVGAIESREREEREREERNELGYSPPVHREALHFVP